MDITETPTVQVIPAGDPQELSETYTKRFEEIYEQVRASDDVAKAEAEYARLAERAKQLEKARRDLNARGKELTDKLIGFRGVVVSSLIEQYCGGEGAAADASIREMVFAEAEHRAVSLAIEQVSIHEVPCVHIAKSRAEARILRLTAEGLERIANERTARAVEMLKDVVEFEGGVEFDARKTLSGALVARATELRSQAATASQYADEAEKAYSERVRALANVNITRGRI